MIHSGGDDCSASCAIVVWSSTTRSAARTLSHTGVKTEAAGLFAGTRNREGHRRDRRRRSGSRRARYSKQGAPGDIHRQRLEYSRPGRRLSTEAGSEPGIVRESHTPGKSGEYARMTIPGRVRARARTARHAYSAFAEIFIVSHASFRPEMWLDPSSELAAVE